jgi:branched-subunit amino acid aminotransferase/4-amino-4-deoxychorismate lyase
MGTRRPADLISPSEPAMPPTVPLSYVNGQFLPQAAAGLPLHDAGFVWGATVTDLCRTFRHKLYRLPDHLARFRRSCRAAHIDPPATEDEVGRAAEELVANNTGMLAPELDLALVLIATPGPVGYYAGQEGGAGEAAATLILHTFPLPLARYRRLVQQGAHLVIPSTRHVPAACVDPRIKQRSRMHWWLAEQEARRADPAATALLLDADGHVTETAAANFLAVRGGMVLSPPRSSVLEGVSLAVVEELCGSLGIPYAERILSAYDCVTADEALLASTPYCLAGVSRIDGTAVPWPGPVLRRLLAAWGEAVGLDIHGQILGG